MRDAGDRTRIERYTLLPAPVEPSAWRWAAAPEGSAFFFLWGAAPRTPPAGVPLAFGPDPDSRLARKFRDRRDAKALAWARSAAVEDDEESDDDSTLSVCCTALYDRAKRESDPGRYVETTDLPYLTLGTRKAFRGSGATLGDLATVVHPVSGRYCHAILGDAREVAGAEPSLFLAESLRLAPGEPAIYLVHPGSGRGQGTIPTREQIDRRGERLFRRPPAPGGPSWEAVLADCFGDLLRADITSAERRAGAGSRAVGV